MKIREFIFKRRGALMAVVALLVLSQSQPSPSSLALGVLLGLAGEALRFWSIGYSRGHTRGLEVEAPFLATGGPYAHCRNPLYLGNGLNSLGAVLAAIGRCETWLGTALVGLTALSFGVVYGAIIPLEEQHLSKVHGEHYQAYRSAVPRLVPCRRPWTGAAGEFCLDSSLYYERWTLLWWALTWAWLTFRVS